MKKYIKAVLCVFIVLAITELFLHTVCLMGLYEQTAHLWRTGEEIRALGWFLGGMAEMVLAGAVLGVVWG